MTIRPSSFDARHALPLARSRAYTLFSRLYLDGVTSELAAAARDVPVLADALGASFDAEQADADHYDLFHLNVFPYASLFLDADGRLGGPVTDDARRLWQEAGYRPGTDDEPPDHVGHALGALAWLSGAEADAWEDDRPDEADRVRRLQRRIVDAYLLWWLPAFTQAVRRHRYPFYTVLADLTLDLVLDHRVALGPDRDAAAGVCPLPDPPTPLDDASTGLADIADYLGTPAFSGFYLSRADISRLGRGERLPRGFGARTRMLSNLLRAAVEFDRIEPLLRRLATLVQSWEAHFTALSERDVPGLEAVTRAWLHRLHLTARLLDRIEAAAADAG